MSAEEIDTVVVPARAEGFQEVFLGKNCWHPVRIKNIFRSRIKYIAVYQAAPVSAITHIATVKSIEPWKDTRKLVVNFEEPAHPVGPIPLVKSGRVHALQNVRYTTRERLLNSKNMDELFSAGESGGQKNMWASNVD